MNIVSEQTGQGAAVLIRAVEPIQGLEFMSTQRTVPKLRELTNGPGKFCQSFGIDLQQNGEDLVKSSRVWIESKGVDLDFGIRVSTRIGISQGQELPYRFFVDGNPFVSGRATDHSVKRDRYLGPIPQKVAP